MSKNNTPLEAADEVRAAFVRSLGELTIDPTSPVPPAVQKAVALARRLQERAKVLQTPAERRQQRELERIMDDQHDKATLIQMTDQAFRSQAARRAADQLTHILDVQGVPRVFTRFDRAMLKGFQSFGSYLPSVAMPMVREKMREETANVILPAEREVLTRHLLERRASGVRMNVNFLGEALLGEEEAQQRLEGYLAALQMPELEVLSVKISTIYSQISSLARHASLDVLCERLELLYRAAAKERFTRADGRSVAKFVYLDMEEYRDLSITLEAFMRTLDRPGLERVSAGIALQAYLPDSYPAQLEINRWARSRVAHGGAPVTIRIVKGANMEAEQVEASIAGWPQAPYTQKIQTDANYKRMLDEALKPENVAAVQVGVGSHNLFDLSFALVLAAERGVLDQLQLEMLEGMANHQRRALCELTTNMLLYAPATRREDFINAIGYLIRRLDENTGPENFLRHAFKLEVDSDEWRALETGFVKAFELIEDLPDTPRRKQDRRLQPSPAGERLIATTEFVNEPDTDFALEANRLWADELVGRWRTRCGEQAIEIPLVVAGEEILAERPIKSCTDPSRPGVVVGRYRQASLEDVDRAIACAKNDPTGWRDLDDARRGAILARVANELRAARGELMGAALADGGKVLSESDPEVSEAIDFVEYYAATARDFRALPHVETKPKGVVAVVPPWNFPIAIPCGGVAAALAAGNNVLLKPASHTVLVAYELCRCFWRGGVPKEALQFLPCSGASGGARLVSSPDVDVVILTGGTDTALRMLEARPEMNLLAETGGKNATVVTAMSDRELAIKHVLHSAFSHGGQKCSATSLLVLEAEVYDDPKFKKTLCDAIRSIRVGSAWDVDNRMGPLVVPPEGDLEKGLKELEVGESWAVMPHKRDDNPCLYTPALKWGTSRRSYTHMTEFFGPLLAVMRAESLAEAIEIVNETGYGLTSGLETLDAREIDEWKAGIHAGNLYVNRVTTGAVVQRQPFGGMGKSAFGPGIKAGGPNYVAQLLEFRDRPSSIQPTDVVEQPDVETLRLALLDYCRLEDRRTHQAQRVAEIERVLQAIASYDASFRSEFGREHDHVALVGQDNIRRYLPVGSVRVRVHAEDSLFDLFARVCAARTAGCRVTVSTPPNLPSADVELLDELTDPWGASIEFLRESDAELAAVIAAGQTERVRYAAWDRAPREVLRSVGASGIFVARTPVLAEGRVELLWYLREQSISHNYHRYGNLGERSDEKRRPVL